MAKKTTPAPDSETEGTGHMDTVPATDEQGGMNAQAVEALAEGTVVQEQPAEAEAEPAQAGEAAPATETPAPANDADEADEAETLETLDSLALRYRVPSWKQAAMLQMQGWAPGKHVSAADYEAALADLSTRPLGGGARR